MIKHSPKAWSVLALFFLSTVLLWRTFDTDERIMQTAVSNQSELAAADTDNRATGFEVVARKFDRQFSSRSITAYGESLAHQTSELNARVGGMIVELDPSFELGRKVQKGQTLVKLDDTDYRFALAQAEQAVADAERTLLQQQVSSERAREEWFLTNTEQPTALVLQLPQLQAAKAQVNSARLQLRKAEHDLASATIVAPFTGWVRVRRASLGNLVSAGTSVGQLLAADKVLVNISLSQNQANLLARQNNYQLDSKVVLEAVRPQMQLPDGLKQLQEQQPQIWQLSGLRLSPDIDPATRQIVAQGIYLSANSAGVEDVSPLKPGIFLKAHIQIEQQQNLFGVPLSALTAQGSLFVLEENHIAEIAPAIKFRNDETVYVDIAGKNSICLVTEQANQFWHGLPAFGVSCESD